MAPHNHNDTSGSSSVPSKVSWKNIREIEEGDLNRGGETSGLIFFLTCSLCSSQCISDAQVSLGSFALWCGYHKHPYFPPPSKGADSSFSSSTISILGQPDLPNQSVLFHYFWQEIDGVLPSAGKWGFKRSRSSVVELGRGGQKQQVWVHWGVVWLWVSVVPFLTD